MSKVLIVEDEFLVASTLKRALQIGGLEVCGIASTGQSAIEMAITHEPTVVLLDVCLAGDLDGLEAGLQIKQCISTQFIVVTGNPTDEVAEDAAQLPALAVVGKPYSLSRLLDVVTSACAAATRSDG